MAMWGFRNGATNSLRLELESQHTLVVGVHLGYTDTAMVADLDVEKNDPADVARLNVAGIEAGATEVIADDVTRAVKAAFVRAGRGIAVGQEHARGLMPVSRRRKEQRSW